MENPSNQTVEVQRSVQNQVLRCPVVGTKEWASLFGRVFLGIGSLPTRKGTTNWRKLGVPLKKKQKLHLNQKNTHTTKNNKDHVSLHQPKSNAAARPAVLAELRPTRLASCRQVPPRLRMAKTAVLAPNDAWAPRSSTREVRISWCQLFFGSLF